MFRVLLLIVVALLQFSNGLAAQESRVGNKSDSDRKSYRIPAADGEISIDGILDDGPWESALVMELPLEVSPGENIPAPVRTEVLLTFSRSCLYVAFKAFDPEPSAVRAHLKDHDKIGGDDCVSITLDTFNDERRAYIFRCNPLGVQADSFYSDTGDEEWDESWDAIWDSAGRITEWGYAVEMAIPFNTMRFPRGEGERTWGIYAGRTMPRNINRKLRNTAQERGNNRYLSEAEKITGLEGISPGRNVEVLPTLTAFHVQSRRGRVLGSGQDQVGDLVSGHQQAEGIGALLTGQLHAPGRIGDAS